MLLCCVSLLKSFLVQDLNLCLAQITNTNELQKEFHELKDDPYDSIQGWSCTLDRISEYSKYSDCSTSKENEKEV